MQKVIAIFFLLSAAIGIFAQCEESAIEKTGKILAAQNFEITRQTQSGETILRINSAAENSSWAIKDSEGAVLTIFVDNQYNQDVMLFNGAEKFVYQVVLGRFAVGKHQIKIALNEARSAKNVRQVKISALDIKQIKNESAADALAVANAPFLYARPDTIDEFSDVPLITYYEVFPSGANDLKIRYTTIFTNEDGGTQTAALMARWGRATDIEWVYEIDFKNGAPTAGIIQGANHATKTFAGKYVFGSHPLIYDATVNNNFADTGCSPLRTAILPFRADLSKKSREVIMDENPWTYKIMAQEAIREGRVNPDNLDANTIADLRDYVYAEIYNEPSNAAITVAVNSPDGKTISSDAGNKLMRVNRPGFVRIALQMPIQKRGQFPDALLINCHSVSNAANSQDGECRSLNLIKVVRLDENFSLKEIKISAKPQNIKSGRQAEFTIKSN